MMELLKAPPSALHLSAERYEELLNAEPGAITSTGRELSHGWVKNTSIEEVKKWAETSHPTRTRDYHNHHQNSDKWDLYVPRAKDIIIDTSYKTGTTWTQTIVANLIFKGKIPGWDDENFPGVMDLSPWVDMRIPPPPVTQGVIANQTHRRWLKSHLPLDGLPYYPEVKYVCIIRDLRDVAYSWYNHWAKASEFYENVLKQVPGAIGESIGRIDPKWTGKTIFNDMADPNSEGENMGMWSYWHHIATWWQYRHLPNIKLMHYANLKKDPHGEIKKLADFLEIEITPEELDLVVHNTTIEYMKEHAIKILGVGYEAMFEGGGRSFINKGTNGRWKDDLSEEECQKYIEFGKKRLGEDTMHWVLTGEIPN